ncbi:MAG: hypothetical protein O2816_16045, partial [Planctomycetota bacterium]|nr:hypothetical protein [Planctomycetota bacterium]
TAALRTGAELPEAGAEQHFAVQTVAGPLTGVRTLRLTGGAARLLETLDGEVPLAVLEQRHPGMTHALTRLAEAGLVTAS